MTLARRLLSQTGTGLRRITLAAWLSSSKVWDWLFGTRPYSSAKRAVGVGDLAAPALRVGLGLMASRQPARSAARSLPPRRVRLALENLEERLAPSVAAIDDSYSTAFAQTLAVQASGVLANDEGSGLAAALVSQPAHGTATVNQDGSLSYTQTDFAFAGH